MGHPILGTPVHAPLAPAAAPQVQAVAARVLR